jgi:hypothetical protein
MIDDEQPGELEDTDEDFYDLAKRKNDGPHQPEAQRSDKTLQGRKKVARNSKANGGVRINRSAMGARRKGRGKSA